MARGQLAASKAAHTRTQRKPGRVMAEVWTTIARPHTGRPQTGMPMASADRRKNAVAPPQRAGSAGLPQPPANGRRGLAAVQVCLNEIRGDHAAATIEMDAVAVEFP